MQGVVTSIRSLYGIDARHAWRGVQDSGHKVRLWYDVETDAGDLLDVYVSSISEKAFIRL